MSDPDFEGLKKKFEEISAEIAALQKAVGEAARGAAAAVGGTPSPNGGGAVSGWDRFLDFSRSGLFFMLVGTAFLIAAAVTMHVSHAAFSFVLVVIGVAILLFGTGTQGVGQADAAGYKVAIAGGAGVIAFCVGWGIVKYADDIKSVFQIEKKYIRVSLEGLEGREYLSNYVAAMSLNGVGVPVVRHAGSMEMYIPYVPSDWVEGKVISQFNFIESNEKSFGKCGEQSVSPLQPTTLEEHKNDKFIVKTFRVQFFSIGGANGPTGVNVLRPTFAEHVTVRLRRSIILEKSSGVDFPEYTERVCVALLHQDTNDANKKISFKGVDGNAPTSSNPPPREGVEPLAPPDA